MARKFDKMKLACAMLWKCSTNRIYSGIHWGKRKAFKDRYFQYTSSLWKNIEPIQDYPVVISYRMYFKGRMLDSLNTVYMAKVLEDCVVKLGIIKDDSPKYVAESRLRPLKGESDRIEIMIEKE